MTLTLLLYSGACWYIYVLLLYLDHRVVRLCIDDLVQEATEAYKIGETKEEIVENIEVYHNTGNLHVYNYTFI